MTLEGAVSSSLTAQVLPAKITKIRNIRMDFVDNYYCLMALPRLRHLVARIAKLGSHKVVSVTALVTKVEDTCFARLPIFMRLSFSI